MFEAFFRFAIGTLVIFLVWAIALFLNSFISRNGIIVLLWGIIFVVLAYIIGWITMKIVEKTS